MTDSIGQRPGGDSAGDLVARFISAFNFRDLDTMLETLDPEVDFHPLRMLGVEHSYRGHSGVEEWFGQITGLDHQHRIAVASMESLPDGGLLVSGRLEAGDNQPTRTPFSALYHVSDGRITVVHHYMSDRQTLDRLGMST